MKDNKIFLTMPLEEWGSIQMREIEVNSLSDACDLIDAYEQSLKND